MIRKLFVFFLCCLGYLLAGITGFAQPDGQKFEHISTEQGLPQTVITCIYQDSRGFIWVGTQQGLHKYDGYTFTTFLHEESNRKSISGNIIRSILEDTQGNLWIGTEGKGLNRYMRNTETFERFAHIPADPYSLADNTVTAIIQDKRGRLWIGTRSGLQLLEKNRFTHYPLLAPQEKHSINALLEDKASNLWISTDKGLYRLPENRQGPEIFTPAEALGSITHNEVHCLFETKNGELLMGTHAGLVKVNSSGRILEPYPSPASQPGIIAGSEIYAIAQDQEGNLWMGTFGNGLLKLNLATQQTTVFTHKPDEKNGISSDVILALLIDKSGLLWAGTYEGVLEKLSLLKTHFNTHTHQPGNMQSLVSNEVYALCEDRAGNLWIGTDNGLSFYTKASRTFQHFTHTNTDAGSLSASIVYALLLDSRQNLWIGTAGGGLSRISAKDLKQGHFRFQKVSLPDGSNKLGSGLDIFTLLEDKAGNIWVGTSKGLYVVDPQQRITLHSHHPKKNHSLSSNEISSLFQDKSGVLWIGTSKGLHRYNPEKQNFTLLSRKNQTGSLMNKTIYAIHEDKEQNLWLGTEDGLYTLNSERKNLTEYTIKDGLPDNVVYGILEDGAANLWLSTNKGLSRIQKNSYSSKITSTNFNQTNWLHCNSFNIGAYHRAASGLLYFGCNEGLVFFHPSDIAGNRFVPPVAITDFQLFFEPVPISGGKNSPLSKAISETEELELKYNQNVLYFEFAALNFINNQKNEYAYFMEGFDKDWNYIKYKRNATYTNLDPGTYTFRVKASNNDGVWNEQGTAIKIIITPPFYRQLWFYVLCAAGIFFMVVAYVHYRTHELEKNEQILVQKVKERTEEVMKQKEELETTLDNLKATQAQLVQAEKMASLGILTAGVAHEINNPINFVSANVDPLQQDIQDVLQVVEMYEKVIAKYTLQDTFHEVESLKKELDYEFLIQEIRLLLQGIKEGASRTADIVKGLRNFSRLDENEMKPVNVNDGIESTLLVLSNQLKNRIQVTKHLGRVDNITGYPGKLNQVFMNVLTNAFQAIPGNGEITIHTYMEHGKVVVRIADNGTGMTEEVKNRIFEPFFTTKKVGAGTGLGLSISYGIIKDHQGEIAVDSTPGKGTTFYIYLPAIRDSSNNET